MRPWSTHRPPVSHDIPSRLQDVFREVFDDDTLKLSDTLDREALEAWDSLGHIRLVSGIEETFGILLSIEEIENLTSVRQIIDLIAAKT